ncbi:MAG TPA: carboxypeptidase M32 [Trueperaceae bacterium]
MRQEIDELLERLDEVAQLQGTAALLNWDQATYMPTGGAETRGRQLALITRLAHEKFVDPAVGSLLDRLERHLNDLDPHSFEARLITVTRFDFERATRVPAEFLAQLERHASRGYQLWARARPANDFGLVREHLERTVELSRLYASFFGGYEHVADALIDESDRGMTVARLRPLFGELRSELLPLLERQRHAQDDAASSLLHGCFPREAQIAFGEEVIRDFGFDFLRGRQDLSHHPFAISFGSGDVRITTRVKEHDLSEALFSTLHEAGHAMYEQGMDDFLDGTPLSGGVSSGVHESQSRLWENLVGRSLEFWGHYYPRLQERFPDQLMRIGLGAFYRAVNRVQPSLIRTDADELTYNLHVMIRFDLECELLEGSLPVRDLAEAWRARYLSDLGVESEGDGDGVLQDMHWYSGLVGGAFQGYTLGNILSAQLFAAAREAHPEIPDEIAQGRFDTLHDWSRRNIWRHGRKYTPDELVESSCGSGLTTAPYIRYLERKYDELGSVV